MSNRKMLELGIVVLLVAGYVVVFPVTLAELCSATEEHYWAAKFWCDVNASDYFIGLFTLFLAIATYFMWRETASLAEGSADQANKMERSIAESARSAVAMEGVSRSMAQNVITTTNIAESQQDFWKRQMRAYLSVTVGTAYYQDRKSGIRFEARPLIVNDGMTPAYNVKHVIKASIQRLPISESFFFDLPESEATGGTAMGPRQNREIWAVVDDFVPDQDVEGIKSLEISKALFVWGKVTYEDAFGVPRYANFAQILFWRPDKSVFGIFEQRHNSSD